MSHNLHCTCMFLCLGFSITRIAGSMRIHALTLAYVHLVLSAVN